MQRFAPAPGPGNYLQVDGARVRGHLAPGAGLTIDYGHQPFVLFNASCTDETETNCEVDDERTKLVAYQLQFNLYGSLVLFERLQVGLNLPLILSNGDGFSELVRGTPTTIEGGTQFTVGDLTLSLKARFFGDGDEGVFLGAVAYASFPVGHAMNDEGFAGDESLRVGGHLVGELVQSNFHVSLNVGGFFRPERTLFSTQQGSALVYRAALGYDVTPWCSSSADRRRGRVQWPGRRISLEGRLVRAFAAATSSSPSRRVPASSAASVSPWSV
ncbi:MAG: hypothetical protein H6723_08805 [Sandaracinus sp.]|nr:hypothetical protein [Sandaracinus sp.]